MCCMYIVPIFRNGIFQLEERTMRFSIGKKHFTFHVEILSLLGEPKGNPLTRILKHEKLKCFKPIGKSNQKLTWPLNEIKNLCKASLSAIIL